MGLRETALPSAFFRKVQFRFLSIIYCRNNGWQVPSDKLFYHNQFILFSKYAELCELMDALGIMYPYYSILKYLLQEPFALKDSTVERLTASGVYSKEAAIALLEFCKGKINIFEYGAFLKTGNDFSFLNSKNIIQYYSDKSYVLDYISKYCSKTFYKLPEEFSSFKDSVIKGETLYESIISISKDEWENDESILASLLNLLSDSGIKDVAKKLVKEISQIKLKSELSGSNITISWLKLINTIFETKEFESLQSKILVDGIRLSELTWNNKLQIEDDNEIEMSSILPKYGESKTISKLKESLIKTNLFDIQKVSSLFDTNRIPTDYELVEIAKEMFDVESNNLKTVDQLRLVIYLYNKGLIASINELNVFAKDNMWHSLANDWYYNSMLFIKSRAVLDEPYKEIGKKKFGSFLIMSRPYFSREWNKFVCPNLCENLEGEALVHFFELIKDQLKKNAQTNVDWLDNLTDNIGFIPKQSVFTCDKYVYRSEIIPQTLIQWGNKSEENRKALKEIGVHCEDSHIIKLRKYLLKETTEYTFEGFLSTFNDKILLLNSLAIMAEATIIFDDDFGTIIKKLTEFIGTGLSLDISQIYLPIAVNVGKSNLYFQMKFVDSAYLISEQFLVLLRTYVGSNYLVFIQKMIDVGINIVDPDCLDEKWQVLYTKKIEFNEPSVNIAVLNLNSKKCDLPHYSRWKESSESEIEIYFIEESIPYSSSIKDFEELTSFDFFRGDSYFDLENYILYTKRGESLVNELSKLRDSNYINTNDLTFLLSENGLALNNREAELLREVETLREQLNMYKPQDNLQRGGLDPESQQDWNLEARNILKEHLKSIPEFDCSEWNNSNIPSSVVKGITYLGKPCIWIVRSAMSNESQFHLTPYEWTLFDEKNVFLALRISEEEIKVYGINEDIKTLIYENNHTINFNFDSVMLTLNGVNALARLLVLSNVWGSGLVFKNPNYSAGYSLTELGNCKNGIINKLNDDAL